MDKAKELNCLYHLLGYLKDWELVSCSGSPFLLVVMNFYDDVIFEDIVAIHSTFDRLFLCEEPGQIQEVAVR